MPLVVAEIGGDVQRHTVECDPAAHPHPDRRDLGLATIRLDPDADPAGAAHAGDPELRKRADQPPLQVAHEAAEVHAPAGGEVEHDVGNPLSGAVISVLAAAARLEDRETEWVEQIVGLRARAGGIERRMLQQPHLLRRPACENAGDAYFHRINGIGIRHRTRRDRPFDRWRVGDSGAGGRCVRV